MSAYQNILRIAKRVKLLEDLYKEYQEICRDEYSQGLSVEARKKIRDEILEEGFVTRELAHYILHPSELSYNEYETIIDIEEFLRVLSGSEGLDEEEIEENFDFNNFFYKDLILLNGHKTGRLMFDIIVEPYLEWLFQAVRRCRIAQRGVTALQNSVIESLYQPGGSMYEQARRRQTGQYGLQG